jgi:hypothetical protein
MHFILEEILSQELDDSTWESQLLADPLRYEDFKSNMLLINQIVTLMSPTDGDGPFLWFACGDEAKMLYGNGCGSRAFEGIGDGSAPVFAVEIYAPMLAKGLSNGFDWVERR